jgi:hypothetical protein
MAQVWLPLDALVEGKLPPQCLITGAVEGVEPRDVELDWDSSGARGSYTVGGGEWIPTGVKRPGKLSVRLPLTQKAYEHLYLARLVGKLLIVPALFIPAALAIYFESWALGLGSLAATVTAISLYIARQPDFGLRRRVGDDVLFELPDGSAADALMRTFPKSVDGNAHSVG